MQKTLKYLHLLGLVLFLGSIFTYVLVSMLVKDGSLADLVFGRQIIRAGTWYLTLPGMWLAVLTGLLMAARGNKKFRERWLTFKGVLALIIVLNAHALIIPTTGDALSWAKESLIRGKVLPEYAAAYLREAIAGTVNVVLILAAMAAGVWKWRGKATREQADRGDVP